MDENWQKENLEKTKEVLKEHFSRKKQEEMMKDMIRISPSPLHFSTIGWSIEESEFDESNDDFEKSKKNFIEKFIWDPPIEKKSKKKSC